MQKINIVELARNLEIYYRETKGRNNSKELKRLGKKSGICVKNGELCIYNENEFDLEGIEDKINDNGIIHAYHIAKAKRVREILRKSRK